MIEHYLLEQFLAFVKYGTLLQAAEELHISQPTLSRSMKKLEEEFGVQLFHRSNSKLILNNTGKVAAAYAQQVILAHQSMLEHVRLFDHNLRNISVGSCASFPLRLLKAELAKHFPDLGISTQIGPDKQLLTDLKKERYQLVIIHHEPIDNQLYYKKIMSEQLYISLPHHHELANRKSVTFADLQGLRILVAADVGFWLDICQEKLNASDLIVQTSLDTLIDIVDASNLPVFNSDLSIASGKLPPGRISLPIMDSAAHTNYYLVCLKSQQKIYQSVFRKTTITAHNPYP